MGRGTPDGADHFGATRRAVKPVIEFARFKETPLRLFAPLIFAAALVSPALAQGDLRGHGGPVRALAVAPSGQVAISGSFDQSAIIWALDLGRALKILRAHEGAVNAVLALPDRFITAGEDGRVAVWSPGADQPSAMVKLHDAPVAALAVAPDGGMFASAGWDRLIKLWRAPDDPSPRVLEGHSDNVNAIAFMPDGKSLVSGGYDATVRIWPLDGSAPVAVTLGSPVSSLAVTGQGVIAAGCADGSVVLLDGKGKGLGARLGTVQAVETPVTSLAAHPDGRRLAAGSPRGAVAMIDLASQRVLFTLNGPGLPVWSLAFTPDGRHLLSGGADRVVRRWDALTGEHIGAIAGAGDDDEIGALKGTRGAEVFKACAVCHTLRPDGAGRAGPTLHGLFGRKAGSVAGYAYSEAFRRLDLVWTEETVSRLFEIGPQAYTPGTKMPEQTVGDAQDRKALIDFLKAATAPN